MNLVLFHLVSGDGWFSCGFYFLLVTLLDAMRVFDERPFLRRTSHFFMVLVIPLAALTGTPMSLWLAIPLVTAVCAHTAFAFTNKNLRFRRISAVVASCLVTASLALELPWYIGAKPPSGDPPLHVYVLGDSLSSGGYGENRSWPRTLAGSMSAQIHDLSRDGATMSTTLAEAGDAIRATPQEKSLVFVELGGNDMLGGTSAGEFESSLDSLLGLCRGDSNHPRTVVMMEIPVLFGKWRFGAAQRRLASHHGVVLIPKRILASIVLDRWYTRSDDLHLSQAGHDRFAELVRPWLALDR